MHTPLQRVVTEVDWPGDRRQLAIRQIASRLARSGDLVGGPNFTRIRPSLIEAAFDAYDGRFFGGEIRRALAVQRAPLSFSLSKRMTRTGGATIRHEDLGDGRRVTKTRFEIRLSATLLFESFRDGSQAAVAGCRCRTRLDALQRILEHEMIHLVEMLVWYDSSCARSRFRGIAHRLFAHRESSHQLITPLETAQQRFGIRPGDQVSFELQGRRLIGKVNRITRRATVLVGDPRGTRYSDGGRYRTYYVPLSSLTRTDDAGAGRSVKKPGDRSN